MNTWQSYYLPACVEEAIKLLCQSRRPKAVIAGGTDLLLDMEQGRHPPADILIDISEISEMRRVQLDEDRIFVGAAVTLSEILENPVLNHNAMCLVEACSLIGGPQIRNVATIGGNVAHALPAADGTIALSALDAEVQIATPRGRTWRALGELFSGPGQPNFDQESELLVGFRIATRQSDEGSAFERVMRPQGMAIAILNSAVWTRRSQNGTIGAARVAVGPGGPRPFRAARTEGFLKGKPLSPDTLKAASEVLLREIYLRDSPHRATKEYRQFILEGLLSQTIQKAYSRATNCDRILD